MAKGCFFSRYGSWSIFEFGHFVRIVVVKCCYMECFCDGFSISLISEFNFIAVFLAVCVDSIGRVLNARCGILCGMYLFKNNINYLYQ